MLRHYSPVLFRFSSALRAPKKKGAAKGSDASKASETFAPGADHIFNIFTDTTDTKRLEDDAYPKWLFELSKPQATYGELESKFVYGKNIDCATLGEYRRFQRHHRKLLIKLNNKRLQKRINNQESKLVN